MRDSDIAATLRRAATIIDDHALLDVLLANINPCARGGAFTTEELANVTRAQVQTVNDWRKRHGIVGASAVVTTAAAVPDANDRDFSLEVAAFRSAEERIMDVRRQVDVVLSEVTSHVIAVEKGERYRHRHEEERRVADMVGEIFGELARVRLLMRESGE